MNTSEYAVEISMAASEYAGLRELAGVFCEDLDRTCGL